MTYNTRRWIKPEDLNPNGTLFGGRIMEWIDEEIGIFSMIQLDTSRTAVKYMSEIDFLAPAKLGEVVEIGMEVKSYGNTSMILKCEMRNAITHQSILTIGTIVMVSLDEKGQPMSHGKE